MRATWLRRVEAEYGSAALSLQLAHWLTEVGAPPALILAGMDVARDEFEHARRSDEVARAAGATEVQQVDRARLAAPRDPRRPVEEDLLHTLLRNFCVGETLAVPLFREIRAGCVRQPARAVLDGILVDEVRHREFSWIALEWLLERGGEVLRAAAGPLASTCVRDRVEQCSSPRDLVSRDVVDEEERAWGMIPAGLYRDTVLACIERELRPRFARLGVALSPRFEPA